MHDIDNEINQVNRRVVESPDLLGKECSGCARILEYKFFQRDTSLKDGRSFLCDSCRATPKLSLAEHTARLQESNFNNYAVRRQRHQHQDDFRDDVAREGRPMHHSEFFLRLRRIVPNLYITPGNVIGDFALYKTYPCGQRKLEGRDFEYLGYAHMGISPEYSQYEFNDRDIMQREKRRGWRTILLRMIKSGMITEPQSRKIFGDAVGPASTVWKRTLFALRNGHE
jgi:hypothetical protein